jgi:hypothetical protein
MATTRKAKKPKAKKPKLTADVTASEFAELGGEIMNRFPGGNQGDFYSRWHSHFYAEPEVCADVWSRLDVNDTDPYAPDDRIAEPCHLLWCLLLLKTYNTEPVLSGLCGGIDEGTFSKWAWHFIEKVSYLEQEVVSCFLCMHNDSNNAFSLFLHDRSARLSSRIERRMMSEMTVYFKWTQLTVRRRIKVHVLRLSFRSSLSMVVYAMS